ncbi:LmeA family phospholipid-binding protein [Rathayibacter tanaceti]|uniref:LmeA family phospholipid-binding protein n=1 Tax=Rathayibacter tanaceti TaxID=1671680 RepID=UPI00082DF60F|nr:LmeA family phospholipid-binding protein [Rathayibacter tanaceti]
MSEAVGPRRRRRGARAALVVAIVLVLVVIAAVVGDSVARRAVADRAAASLREALALPADHAVDVDVAGWAVLPQLLRGRLDRLDLRSSDARSANSTAMWRRPRRSARERRRNRRLRHRDGRHRRRLRLDAGDGAQHGAGG